MKNIFVLIGMLVLSAPAFGRGSPRPKPTLPPIIREPSTEIANGVHFSPVRNYKFEELEVLAVAEKLSNQLLHSVCFQNFMVNRNLIQTNGKTAIEVVEDLKTTKLTIPVSMYYTDNGVVGYRQPPAPDIFTNRKYHAGSTACARGSNLLHEWSHSDGYQHASARTLSRPRSVPYSINAAFTACCICEKNTIQNCKII